MNRNEDSGSPGWLGQTTEEVAKAVAAAASAATLRSRPSVVFSSNDSNGNSQLQKLQRHVTRVLQGFSSPPQERRRTYNPEILTSQKRQWARFQLRSLDQRTIKEPSKIFESLVVVGLHPSCDLQILQKQLLRRNSDGSKKSRLIFDYRQQVEEGLHVEPQVLFVYPPKKQLPFKYKDLISFCFPGGLEVRAVERTPSMSELNEILLGQEHLKQSDMSFVFRLQVPDGATFYGCCILVEEIIRKPSGLLARLSEDKGPIPFSRRCILTAPRCYCIISQLPFFDLHFGVLKTIFTEARLERLTEDIGFLSMIAQKGSPFEDDREDTSNNAEHCHEPAGNFGCLKVTPDIPDTSYSHDRYPEGGQSCNLNLSKGNDNNTIMPENSEIVISNEIEYAGVSQNGDILIDMERNRLALEKQSPDVVLPLLRYQHYESSDSASFQGSPSDDHNSQSEHDDTENEETSSSGHEDFNDQSDILEWAKANNRGCLQIICEYYKLNCPARGSKLTFHPLEHLHPLHFYRPGETVLHTAGSTIDIRTCSTSLEVSEAHNALFAEEEATALAVWAVACICGKLRLENVLTMFAGALLEKQIVVVCSNLGILSAIVLSVIPLIRPYQWQSLLMPVLPNDMLDFLEAPVPYIVGIKNKTAEVQSKLSNVILVDANRNQVKSSSMPKLPQQKELQSSLSTYHATLVGESFLARNRPVYECTDTQVEAAKGFLAVLRSYLDGLCSNLRSHTITNVQSNDDKVSLLLKESFIDSYSYRDRPFMKLFVDTQLFSMHTDLILSVYQKE